MHRLPKVICMLVGVAFLWTACKNNSGKRFRHGNDSTVQDAGTVTATSNIPVTPAAYNVYIENSGSMNGYVTIGSEFKNAVLGIITDLKSKQITDTVSIYYINKQICPQKENALPDEIKYFFNNLNPTSFRNSGCGTSTSFLPEIIKRAVGTKANDVNILISDFIFSDSAGTSAAYLEAAQNTVKLYLSEELKRRDFATVIVKLNSVFNGKYFIESKRPAVEDFTNKPIHRPYYIIIFGKQAQLQSFLDKIAFTDYKGFEDVWYLFPPSKQAVGAKIVLNNKVGEFKIAFPATRLVINQAKPDGNKEFRFSVAANLEYLKTDKSFLLDITQYEVPDNYKLVGVKETGSLAGASLNGYTHIFTLAGTELPTDQEVFIKLKPRLPRWVMASSTIDDANPADSLQQHKTFGFEFLVKGMADAYKNNYADAAQFTMKVKVSKANGDKSGTHGGFPWWVILVLLGVIGLIIWLKNRS